MKKLLLPAALLALALTASAQSKFNAMTGLVMDSYKSYLSNPKGTVLEPIGSPVKFKSESRALPVTGWFVTLAPGYDSADLEALGLTVNTVAGNIAIVEASLDLMLSASESPAIAAVEISQEVTPLLDKSREATGMDKVQAGAEGIGSPLDGTGVFCALYDTGLDPNHINFYDKDLTRNRVQSVWNFTGSGGSNRQYTGSAIADFTTDNTAGTHGTHVLGCMAGANNSLTGTKGGLSGKFSYIDENGIAQMSGSALRPAPLTNNPYYGMAPGADILISCGQLYDANMTAGIQKMARYAKEQGKPCVVNLSVGSVVGSHDSHNAFNKALDAVANETGALIFVASGNDGDVNLSIVKELTASNKEVRTFFYNVASAANSCSGRISVYANNNQPLTIKPVILNTKTGGIVYDKFQSTGPGTMVLASSNYTDPSYVHATQFDQAFANSSHFRISAARESDPDDASYSRYGAVIDYNLAFNSTSNKDKHLLIALVVEGAAGQRVEMAMNSDGQVFTANGMEGYTDGTPDFSFNNLGCGKKVFMVGAWNTRNRWALISKSIYVYSDEFPIGEIASFSSYGTAYDGTVYPFITAPGTGIISSLNSYNTGSTSASDNNYCASYTFNGRKYVWDIEQGTSMATPIAAGCVASWLQADPTLTFDEVKEIMALTADRQSDKRFGPNGKINAYAGAKEVIRRNPGGVSDIVADNNQVMVVANGTDSYNVFVPGASHVSATLYSMQGASVLTAAAAADEVNVSVAGLPKGVYILNVNNSHSQRILVK